MTSSTSGSPVTISTGTSGSMNSIFALSLATSAGTNQLFNFSYEEAYKIMLNHSRPARFNVGVELLLVVFYALLVIMGVVCNAIVCYVIGRHRQRRVARNLYVLNLAVSDLTLSIICTPFTLLLLLERTWTFGGFLCRLLPVVQGANIFVSAATITVIAVDRYFTIVVPSSAMQTCHNRQLQRGSNWQRRQAIVVCLTIWIISVTLTLPLAFFQEVEKAELNQVVLYCACVERWPSPQLRGMYTVTVMLLQYVIPTAILTTTHLQITRHLRTRGVVVVVENKPRSKNDTGIELPSTSSPSTTPLKVCAMPASKRTINELVRYRRATITLVVVAAVFAASWLPLHVFSLMVDFEVTRIGSDNLYAVFAGCHSLAMTSACSNPILYGAFNTNFRREVGKLINRRCLRLSVRRIGRLQLRVRAVYRTGGVAAEEGDQGQSGPAGGNRRDSDVDDEHSADRPARCVALGNMQTPETSPSGALL